MHSIYEEQPTDMKREKYFRNFARNWEKHKHQPFSQKNLKTKKKKVSCSSEAKVIQYENEQYAAHVTESQKGSYN